MSIDRKAAITAYKERKTIAGIYVVRCAASGQAWVGQAPNLETIQNRIWFSLRQGSHTCRGLQAAWTTYGEAGLTFAECERLEDEESAYVRNALLKERLLHWRAELKAEPI
ncbi:GIY-YIG nuclease family protein [Bradyrhizobium japonicum]|uniref:GIY-YIG nuclease family protein n=1 Tax=Bradyrhizobium japonicum TaxID=375 RepID=UPI0004268CB9|nr:GIY-YIG nuclease family protein [Bradyrhizobium japonicum]